MAEFPQKQRKRHDDDVLGSAVNFLLANARLVLGVGGAAVLGIATLAVKRVRPCWTSSTWGSRGGSQGWAAVRGRVGPVQGWRLLPLPAILFALPWDFAVRPRLQVL